MKQHDAGTDGDRIQPHWTSAYDGYGTSSLDTDVGELSALVEHIRKEDGKHMLTTSSSVPIPGATGPLC